MGCVTVSVNKITRKIDGVRAWLIGIPIKVVTLDLGREKKICNSLTTSTLKILH